MSEKKEPVILDAGVKIPKPNIQTIEVTLTAKSPLIFHKWSEKAKKQILDKQQKRATKGKEIRNPEKEYEASFYYNKEGNIAFPAGSIKKSIVGAARSLDDVAMTEVRAALFVVGDDQDLIPVKYKSKEMREDMVRIGRGSADLRYRGQLNKWSMTFNVEYNANVFSAEMVLNLFETAGFSQGLGEWRPERSGNYGKFTTLK